MNDGQVFLWKERRNIRLEVILETGQTLSSLRCLRFFTNTHPETATQAQALISWIDINSLQINGKRINPSAYSGFREKENGLTWQIQELERDDEDCRDALCRFHLGRFQ